MEGWKIADTGFLPVFLRFHPSSKHKICFLILLRDCNNCLVFTGYNHGNRDDLREKCNEVIATLEQMVLKKSKP